MAARDIPAPAALGGPPEAQRLLSGAQQALSDLRRALEDETAHLSAGRLREGLATASRKSELAASYILQLRALKANVVALTRFAPDALASFRAAQNAFMAVVQRNQAVLETVRSVSEGLIKSLADEMERKNQVGGYGIRSPARPATASPLVFSARF